LCIPMGHRCRRLLVRAREPFGTLIAAVIDERFLKPTEARPGICGAVFDAERLEDIDHEVRTRFLVPHDLDWRIRLRLLGLGRGRGYGHGDKPCRTCSSTFQKT